MLLPNDTQQFAFILISQFILIERIALSSSSTAALYFSKKNKGLANYNALWGEHLASHHDIVWFCLIFGLSN